MSNLTTLPASNSYEGMFVNALNFPPLDFNFYQNRAPVNSNSELISNRLNGCFNLTSSLMSVNANNITLNQGNPLSELTIECWVKANLENAGDDSVLWSYNASGDQYIVLTYPYSLTLGISNGTDSTSINTGKSIMDGLWHHIAVVLSETEGVKIYLDTIEVPLSQTYDYEPVNDEGSFELGSTATSMYSFFFFQGMIGQVRIWTEARSLMDIIYCAGRYLSATEMQHLGLYWSDAFDAGTNEIADSSRHDHTGTVSNPENLPGVWNTSIYYGALINDDHLLPHPVNMTGNAVLDNTGTQRFQKNITPGTTFTSLSAECWIKVDSGNNTDRAIMALVYSGQYIFHLKNPQALELHFTVNGAPTITTNISLMDGKWHHIAFTWQSATSLVLYIDSVPLYSNTTSASAYTFSVNADTQYSLYLGGTSSSSDIAASISEFRFWTTVRTAAEVRQDASYRLNNAQPGLLIYWPFARNFEGQNYVEDLSGNGLNANPHGSPTWSNQQIFGLLANGFIPPPVPDSSEDAGPPAQSWQFGQVDLTSYATGGTMVSGAIEGFPSLSIDQLEQAFDDAHDDGYFDPVVFPNIYFTNDTDRADAKAAIETIEFAEFLSFWIDGKRLSFYRAFDHQMVYEFIPAPNGYGPTLLLLLDTRITSYYGELGGGQIVRTFSLMPGENTYVSIDTYKKTTEQESNTSSIFDSDNASSQDSFQNSLDMEAGVDTSLAAALDFHLSGETKQHWIEGNLDVKGSVNASLKAKVQAHLQAVSNAMSSHASERSSERNVEVNTTYTVTSESGMQTAVTREFKNINNSCTLDIIFRQLNQQFVVQHMLTNIRIGYFDPAPGSYRAVQLSQLDDLLDQVLVDNASIKSTYKNRIITAAYTAASMGICNYNINHFIQQRDKVTGAISNIPVDGSGNPTVSNNMDYFILPSCTSSFTIANQNTSAAGVVLSTDYFTLRTDNVVADLALGQNPGLDDYAKALREEAVRRQEAENSSIEVGNRRIAAALGIYRLAKEQGMTSSELADLYKQLFINKPGTITEIIKDTPPAVPEN